MKSQIYEEIINGKLSPCCFKSIENYEAIAYLLDETPLSIEGVEKILSKINSDNNINFKDDLLKETPGNEANENFTLIKDYHYAVDLPFSGYNDTPHERYYKALITNEATRIKLKLIKIVNSMKNNDNSRNLIKETLCKISIYTYSVSEIYHNRMHPDLQLLDDDYPIECHRAIDSTFAVFKLFITCLTKIYYELVIIFFDIIRREDFLQIPDFFNTKLEIYYKGEYFTNVYNSAFYINEAQKVIDNNDDRDRIEAILKNLFVFNKLNIYSLNEKINNTIIALENHLYLNLSMSESLSFKELLYQSNNIFIEQKKKIHEKIKTNPYDAILILEELKDNLFFFEDNDCNVNSVPRRLLPYITTEISRFKSSSPAIISPSSPTATTHKTSKTLSDNDKFSFTCPAYRTKADKFNEFVDNIIDYQFIKKEDKLKFKRLFNNTSIERNERIMWIGGKSNLTYLFKQLKNNGIIQLTYNNHIWKTVAHFFCDENGNPYEPSNLNKQQKPKQTAEKIIKIVKELK